MTYRLVAVPLVVALVCAMAQSMAAAAPLQGTITVFGGPVYSAPWPAAAEPHPIATLDTGTPVTVVCRTTPPDETPDQATAYLSWFYRITWAGGTGYVEQTGVKITSGGDTFTLDSIPSC
jgi:hypothetical protein